MRWRLASIAALLLAAGCAQPRTAGQIPATTPPSVPPHAQPVQGRAVTGFVTDTAGHPVAGATVVVSVALSSGEQAVRAIGAFSTVGFYCLLGCSAPHDSGFTARDGSFALSLPGRNAEHDDYNITAAAARGPARVATSVVLPWRRGSTQARIRLAAGAPHVRALGNRRFVVPPPLPLRYRPSRFEASLETETGTPPVADGHALTVTNGYDARVVEDEHLLLTTAQSGRLHGRDALFSSSLELRGTDVPASRGAGCSVTDSRGQQIRQPKCGLTDGVLDSDWQPVDDPRCAAGPCAGSAQHDHRDVTVTLRRPVPAALLVVRGCLSCTVSISPGGGRFTRVATEPFGSADDVLVASLPGTRVDAVRVETDTGGFFTSLREVSVFAVHR
ncbi:MAG TPA: hypothetical protein VHC43_02820 [Mycobacteriales bacterium]|nr:hypothetical protein [Mycobacteriales bacterium]